MGTLFLRGRRLAVTAAAAAALAGAAMGGAVSASVAAATEGVAAATAASQRSATSPACADVLFVGARGSGEKGPGDKGWKPSKSDPHGLGATVNSVYDRVAADLRGYRTLSPVSVRYAANGVQTLLHAPNEYFSGLAAGVTWTLDTLASKAKACPGQPIVLAGFSQGAMVMHRVLHDLGATAAKRRILARVAAAVLVGDGDEVPDDNQIRFGTAARNARGIGQSLRKLSHASAAKFSPSVGSRVLSVCNTHDLVCGWTDFNLACLTNPVSCIVKVALMIKIHLSYPGSKPLLAAAGQAARDVLTGHWHAGRLIDAAGFTGVSCPTDSYCLAVDSDGNAYTYSRGTWSGPADVADGNGLAGISCASPGFCAAVTSGATVYVDSGGTWTSSQLAGADGNPANLTAVSCPASGYCVATGDWDSYTFSHGTWAKGVLIQDTNTFTSISCPSTSFCTAADSGGNVYSESRGTWSAARQIGGGDYLTSVSCPTASFCVVTSSGNAAFTDSRGSWSAHRLAGADGNPANLTAVSCPASGYCVATGDWDGYLYTVGTWAKGVLIQDTNTFTSVSCATAAFCTAVDNAGNAYTYTGG
jgi:Cutinase